MKKIQAASDYIVKWAVNRMYCVILKDSKFINYDRDQPKGLEMQRSQMIILRR